MDRAAARVTGAPTALHALGVAELAAGYRSGDFTPLDVLDAVLARIARWEPTICALWAADADAARVAAAASAERWARGAPVSPLDGVPVTVKENIATRGTPVPLGTAATELAPAAADAPPAARLREAGAVLLGKTTMPDYGMLSSGLSSFHALTRNPWHAARNPGGSSAGAGAAAAAGYGPIHVGTDIGGSIRLPAGWCGVVGFKPSAGRVPIVPPYLGRVAGPLTRCVADCAAAMAVLARPDRRDATALPAAAVDWSLPADEPEAALAGRTVGVQLAAGWGLPLDRGIEASIRAAAARIAAAGARVVDVPPFTTRAMADGIDAFWRLRAWVEIDALPAARRERVLPFIRDWAAPAARYTAAQAFAAYGQFAALRDAAQAATDGVDFIVSPVSPIAAFDATWAGPTQDPARALEHIGYTLPWNFGGHPAVALPCGVDADGMPIGLQIVGQRHDDTGLLAIARAWERLRDPLPAWPEPRPG